MEFLKLIVIDMSWQFSVMITIILVCALIVRRIAAEQRNSREKRIQDHEEAVLDKRIKLVEHKSPSNPPRGGSIVQTPTHED